MNLDLRGRPSAGEVLARIRNESRDQSEKGRWFEQLFMRIALQEPEFEVAEIWRWPDWPEREALTALDGRDIGIDLVANGGLPGLNRFVVPGFTACRTRTSIPSISIRSGERSDSLGVLYHSAISTQYRTEGRIKARRAVHSRIIPQKIGQNRGGNPLNTVSASPQKATSQPPK